MSKATNPLRAVRQREIIREVCGVPTRDTASISQAENEAVPAGGPNASGVAAAKRRADQLRDDPAGHFAGAAAALQRARTLPQTPATPAPSLVPAKPYFVPTLSELCAQTLANHFAEIRGIDALADRAQYDLIISQVPTDLPLEVAVARITSESYWKECCEARFALGQLPEITKTGRPAPPAKGGWRRVYLERDLEEFLMGLKIDPNAKDLEALQHKLNTVAKYVYALKLFRQRAHIDIVDLFAKIPHLESFSVSYGVLNAKDAMSPDMIGMKQADAVMFQKVLRSSQSLVSLALRECGIDDVLGLAICSGLVKNKTLQILDLSHNRIGNSTAHALELLLYSGETLREIHLANNDIRDTGAAMLARGLQANAGLQLLDLRINRIDTAGGCALLAALAQNSTLTALSLSANHLGPDAARAARDALPSNSTLVSLHLSSNALGEIGGQHLAHAIQHSSQALVDVEVRESGIAPQEAEAIRSVCAARRDAVERAAMDKREQEQREEIARVVKDKIRRSHNVL